ncbi:LuxR C-terminal-related transcriptional regulator [Citrobacter sp. CK189]|uniref:LuxR family transcriptional regulator n=1 Tax=Citrobacter sp. CK189 TaxID=2985098 RepID=UPI002578F5BD|nr:LuxR family transcriptional regulator [Citrobacter sp. CK189]MDM3017183.1 LuxR C-terminal-related transcriptional regulator [Citrobacter sp. CK189]HAV2023527.1 LuxR family transcriptional regulator [Citrobacter koseri]
MVDNEINITTLGYQEIAGRTRAPQSGTIIINVIHKDISAARTVALLNRLRMYLTHCTLLVLIVKSDLASLCRELLDLENVLILTENASCSDLSAILKHPLTTREYQRLYTRRKLTTREQQVLALMIASHNNKQIAELLNIDYKTAHTHRASIMRKLGMNNSQVMNKRIVNMFRC